MKTWSVWSEGYRASGDSSPAIHHGEFEGETFRDAVIKCSETLSNPSLIDLDRLTYWGCRFFDNESDARRSFG